LRSHVDVIIMSETNSQLSRRVLPTIENEDGELMVGQWFWIQEHDDKKPWLGCIVHLGSNYAEFDGPAETYGGVYTTRVHFNKFYQVCKAAPDAEEYIARKVEKHRGKARALMAEVQEITRSLAISPRQSLSDGSETQALAIRSGSQPVNEYKEALILAKEKTLPELFDRIKRHNEAMAAWLQAPILAMEGALAELQPAIKVIKARVFHVELYAGLIEQVEQVKEGEPAPIGERVRLFQRRAYMDEECLAEYRTGGMTFKDIQAFDKWVIEPENLERLLPFPRCVLAFQVRRNEKHREGVTFRDFINILFASEADELTFLYIRNGEQVFRLSTGIEFGSKLFPDIERSELGSGVYAKMFGGRVDKLISEGEHLQIFDDERKARKRYEEELAEWKRTPKKKRGWEPHYFGSHDKYIFWSPESVYYDDISEHVKDQIDEHNRLVLVLQGLLDRSPVFHPHPPWQLWSNEGFAQAVELIYDQSRALVAGDAPDFEAYREELNRSIKAGSVTVGQEVYWEQVEAERYNRWCHNNWRIRHHVDVTRHRPYGNPGPGTLATVVKATGGRCFYKWKRERLNNRYSMVEGDDAIACSIAVPKTALLHVNAYAPGDFKQFFADPRTRADYLRWAPYLLECEEWWAGNRNGR